VSSSLVLTPNPSFKDFWRQPLCRHAPAWRQGTVFNFLLIALPVVAEAVISIVSINDLHRRVARYRDMQATLAASESH
jgi:hypothetical protein